MAIKTNTKLNNVVNKLIDSLKDENIIFYEVYLFGSYINGTPDEWSDIDVAIVVDEKYDLFDTQLKIMKLSRNIDIDIEVHLFNKKMFNLDNPICYQIIETGKKVA